MLVEATDWEAPTIRYAWAVTVAPVILRIRKMPFAIHHDTAIQRIE